MPIWCVRLLCSQYGVIKGLYIKEALIRSFSFTPPCINYPTVIIAIDIIAISIFVISTIALCIIAISIIVSKVWILFLFFFFNIQLPLDFNMSKSINSHHHTESIYCGPKCMTRMVLLQDVCACGAFGWTWPYPGSAFWQQHRNHHLDRHTGQCGGAASILMMIKSKKKSRIAPTLKSQFGHLNIWSWWHCKKYSRRWNWNITITSRSIGWLVLCTMW